MNCKVDWIMRRLSLHVEDMCSVESSIRSGGGLVGYRQRNRFALIVVLGYIRNIRRLVVLQVVLILANLDSHI